MKRFMAALAVFIFVTGISIAVYAQMQEGTKAPMTLEERKSRLLILIDERIKLLQETRTCIESAKTDEELMKCKQSFRAERKELREEMRERRMRMQKTP